VLKSFICRVEPKNKNRIRKEAVVAAGVMDARQTRSKHAPTSQTAASWRAAQSDHL
jgi:hypothetical protein